MLINVLTNCIILIKLILMTINDMIVMNLDTFSAKTLSWMGTFCKCLAVCDPQWRTHNQASTTVRSLAQFYNSIQKSSTDCNQDKRSASLVCKNRSLSREIGRKGKIEDE